MQASIDTLKSQLLQLKQLHEAGALGQAEYDSSKAGLERRLLDLVLAAPSSPGAEPDPTAAAPLRAAASDAAPVAAQGRAAAGALSEAATAPARPSRRFLAGLALSSEGEPVQA
jgi:hypothetical protein